MYDTDQPSSGRTIYQALAAPFDQTYTDERGFTYVKGKQVVDRLVDVLGIDGWDFTVFDQGIDYENNQVWVRGTLRIKVDGEWISRSQFGSSEIKRRRSDNKVLDIGFDLKGSATDCLKKCATLFGVALYLYDKESPAGGGYQGGQQQGYGQGSGQYNAPSNGGGYVTNGNQSAGADLDALYCEECGEPLTETRFKDGTNWAPAQLAVFGRRKHSRILCMTHYREANQAKRRAEEALSSVPF